MLGLLPSDIAEERPDRSQASIATIKVRVRQANLNFQCERIVTRCFFNM